jgi:hypothetical protein
MGIAKEVADNLKKSGLGTRESGLGRGCRIANRESRVAVVLFAAALLLAGTTLRAQTPESASYAVVVTSLGGDAEYEKLIQGWGKDLAAALRKDRAAEGRVFWLAAVKEEGAHAVSRKEEIAKLFAELATRVRPTDRFALFLVGHGSYDEYDYRLSVPGPDLTAAEWAELLNRIPAQKQVVATMTSGSGGSLSAFQRKGRVVITSTTAGRERNFSVFARYFVAALQDEAADADKNQEISALEAFRYASREVARYYETAKRLATEHPILEDKGEGDGVREPSPETGQGLLASSIVLVRLGNGQSAAAETPAVRDLRARKRKLEESIEELKYRKAGMETAQYAQELEKLLLELSRAQLQLDDLEKKSEPRP